MNPLHVTDEHRRCVVMLLNAVHLGNPGCHNCGNGLTASAQHVLPLHPPKEHTIIPNSMPALEHCFLACNSCLPCRERLQECSIWGHPDEGCSLQSPRNQLMLNFEHLISFVFSFNFEVHVLVI
jgi:hypothetical protein